MIQIVTDFGDFFFLSWTTECHSIRERVQDEIQLDVLYALRNATHYVYSTNICIFLFSGMPAMNTAFIARSRSAIASSGARGWPSCLTFVRVYICCFLRARERADFFCVFVPGTAFCIICWIIPGTRVMMYWYCACE